MRRDPQQAFTKALKFLNIDPGPDKIEECLKNSDLSILQEQERQHGFKEKMIRAKSFFRKGKVGEWREVLSTGQVNAVVNEHKEVMKRFGYLDEQGMVVDWWNDKWVDSFL